MEYKEFKNQYGDLVREISLEGKLFSIEIVTEDQKEINEDFIFRYGKNELSIRALELLIPAFFIANN
jgi:hypothetical protein